MCVESYKAKGYFKKYSFDIYRADEFFNHLLEGKIIKLPDDVKLPYLEELKGKKYCKWHNSWTHSTNNCSIFRDRIQDLIRKGKLKFPEKQMGIDEDPFPAVQEVSINMNEVSIEALIEERKKAQQEDHAKRLEAMAKRSLTIQAPDENFAKNLYAGCRKKVCQNMQERIRSCQRQTSIG